MRAQRPTSARPGDARDRARRRHDRGLRRRRVRRVDACACTRCGRWRPASRCCCGSCPATADGPPASEGAVVGRTTRACRGGALEIFLEPHAARAARRGASARRPIARALARAGAARRLRGRRGRRRGRREPRPGDAAAGRRLARPRRGGGAAPRRCERGVPVRRAGRQRACAARRCSPRCDGGRDAGARARRDAGRARHRRAHAEEIALSILAEIVAVRRARRGAAATAAGAPAPATAVDPVCGMTVVRGRHAAARARRATVAFCCEGCRDDLRAGSGPVPPSADPFVAGLVLAAGGSRRLGRPKQLLPLRRRRRCSTTCSATARACRVRPARRARSAARADEVRAARRPRAAPTSSSTDGYGDGLLVLDRRGARRAGPALRRARAAARRPARRRARRRCARCSPAAATRRWPSAATRTAAGTRSPSRARAVRRPGGAARRQGGVEAARPARRRRRRGARSPGRSRATSTPGRTTRRCWRRSDAVSARRARGAAAESPAVPTSRRSPRGSTRSTTSPTRAWPRRCSSPCASRSRCCSRARPASARPRRPRRWPRRSDTPLIRLQCYEGIDAAEALYEWNYPRQLLRIRLAEAAGDELAEDDLFGRRVPRRAARCCRRSSTRARCPAVLLIDELDRADDDFEAFLLELLAEASRDDPRAGHDPRDASRPPSS